MIIFLCCCWKMRNKTTTNQIKVAICGPKTADKLNCFELIKANKWPFSAGDQLNSFLFSRLLQ